MKHRSLLMAAVSMALLSNAMYTPPSNFTANNPPPAPQPSKNGVAKAKRRKKKGSR